MRSITAFPARDIVVDPLVMPIGAINRAAVQVMHLLHRLKTELKVNTTCGASNISFGLPRRNGINAAFLTMAIGSGMTSAITNPLHPEVVEAVLGADVMMGHDPDCARWIRKFREPPPAGADGRGWSRSSRGRSPPSPDAGHLESRMAAADALVVFTPSGKRGRFELGTPLLSAARSLGVDIDSVCGGRALCTRCQVLIAEGEFAKHNVRSSAQQPVADVGAPSNGSPIASCSPPGADCPARRGCRATWWWTCRRRSQVHRQVVRKAAESRDIELYPVITLHYVEVAEPDMHDPIGDLKRLADALAREWQLDGAANAICRCCRACRRRSGAGKWKVTVAVHDRSRIVSVWPGLHEKVYGLAVDVGSTTIAAHLCDLTTRRHRGGRRRR